MVIFYIQDMILILKDITKLGDLSHSRLDTLKRYFEY